MKRASAPLFLVVALALLSVAGVASAESGGLEGSPSAEIPADALAPAFCSLSTAQSSGPADGCCTRRSEICDAMCSCGVDWFICDGNSTGGCSSGCKCNKCV